MSDELKMIDAGFLYPSRGSIFHQAVDFKSEDEERECRRLALEMGTRCFYLSPGSVRVALRRPQDVIGVPEFLTLLLGLPGFLD